MPDPATYVTRGGEKLAAALDHFQININGLTCADLGSHEGGFVDCLLQGGAAKVYSIDTAYGTLAWKLRKDPRVIVMERTNALHATLPERVDLITIDTGWTPQSKILPAAANLLAPEGKVITLIKPHYEADKDKLEKGILPDAVFQDVVDRVLVQITAGDWQILGTLVSPIRGHSGNQELLALLRRGQPSQLSV